jgi:hypothetical protein
VVWCARGRGFERRINGRYFFRTCGAGGEERGFGGPRCLSSFTGDFAGAKSSQLRLGDRRRALIGWDPISALRPERRRCQKDRTQGSRDTPLKRKKDQEASCCSFAVDRVGHLCTQRCFISRSSTQFRYRASQIRE